MKNIVTDYRQYVDDFIAIPSVFSLVSARPTLRSLVSVLYHRRHPFLLLSFSSPPKRKRFFS